MSASATPSPAVTPSQSPPSPSLVFLASIPLFPAPAASGGATWHLPDAPFPPGQNSHLTLTEFLPNSNPRDNNIARLGDFSIPPMGDFGLSQHPNGRNQ